jgi:hypothetical protein
MAKVDATQMQDKYSRRLKAAGQDITAGINRTTVAPGAKAATQAQVMVNNMAARVADGTWQRRVAGVTLEQWKAAAINKGVGRIAAGVDQAKEKTIAMFGKVLSAVDQAVAVVEQTPRGDLNTNIQRAVTFMNEMSKRAPSRQG